MKKKRIRRPKHFVKDNTAGSLLEYGLIIGFSIVVFLIIVGIVTSILDWSKGNLSDFFSIFQG
ncbi:MAG: Flp family type IVb pilin [Promethearchaeota archaeon]